MSSLLPDRLLGLQRDSPETETFASASKSSAAAAGAKVQKCRSLAAFAAASLVVLIVVEIAVVGRVHSESSPSQMKRIELASLVEGLAGPRLFR